MLFTLPDVCLLAKMLNGTDMFPGSGRIPTDRKIDFEFFRFEVWDVGAIGLKKPELTENRVETVEPSPLSRVAESLFAFLAYAREDAHSPDGLTAFLQHHERLARLTYDHRTYTRVNHFSLRLCELPADDYPLILPFLDDEVRRRHEYADRNHALLTGIARMSAELERELDAYKAKTEQSDTVLYGALLGAFLSAEPSIKTTIAAKRDEMLVSKPVFVDFYSDALGRLKVFLAPFADHAFARMAAHLHTWALQRMNLESFINYHDDYMMTDDLLCGVPKDMIAKLCIEPAPAKLKKILDHPPLFEFAKIELHGAEFVELPIEAMARIAHAINLVQKIFELTAGSLPQADEMTPLLNFALMSCGLAKMYSLQKYLEHFLAELPQSDAHILSDAEGVALTHFINHVQILESVLGQQ
jgi:hypothetical protein